jgi:SP family arabinose:H+ symporter-like MFS transporter
MDDDMPTQEKVTSEVNSTISAQATVASSEADALLSKAPAIKSPGMNYICLAAALGGLLFGFDTAVISGTISFVKTQYVLNATSEGWFVSCGLLGCIIGVIACSFLSDRIGRKKILIWSGIMFLLSSLGCAFAPNFDLLVLARLIGGIGVGMASVVSPMYIAEFAPAATRGKMIACYQLAITVGILLAYFSNMLILSVSKIPQTDAFLKYFLQAELWRPMFLVMGIPSAAFAAMLLSVPESPRWLFSVNRKEEAAGILKTVKGNDTASQELTVMSETAAKHTGEQRSLADPSLRLPLLIGIVLAVLQQFCGINAIIYYGPRIFQSAGIAGGDALTFQVIIGVINVLFTFVAINNADKYGRKFLLLSGLTGIIASLVVCGALFFTNSNNSYVLLGSILTFIACFALSLGPITWIMINEIFPTEVRGRAVSLCTLILWLAVWVVGQFFPWLVETAGPAVTFWTFAFCSGLNMLFSWKVVRETKNKSLEEMENLFVAPH